MYISALVSGGDSGREPEGKGEGTGGRDAGEVHIHIVAATWRESDEGLQVFTGRNRSRRCTSCLHVRQG